MINMLKLLSFFMVATLSGMSRGSTKFMLSEASLKELAMKGAPQIDQIQASFLATDLQNKQTQEVFAPEFFGRASVSETNEKPIIEFMPVWTPLQQAQVGVRQNLKKGFYAQAAVTTDLRSATTPNSNYRDVTTTSVSFTLQMDLWRDLLGRISEARLETAQLESKRAKIEREIQTKSFIISLRRIYWSLIATEESIKISEEMLKISEKQLAEAKSRFRNSVAEADEVARNEAQVASKKSSLLYYQYQKENYIKQLKTLLPDLAHAEIVLTPYDITETVNEVTACTATIGKEPKIPYHFTNYDEATELIRQVKAQTISLNSRYSDPDVKLFGTVKNTGVASENSGAGTYKGSFDDSVDDMRSHNRTGYEVGLQVTIPLGSARKDTQKTKELYDEKRLTASIDAADAQVINTHQQLVRTITLLNEVVRSQKTSTQQLQKRLFHMERKYKQARVSINDLIQDQDALLRSSLVTVESQLQVLNVLFDYLAIYTETPCTFNRI